MKPVTLKNLQYTYNEYIDCNKMTAGRYLENYLDKFELRFTQYRC